MNAVLVDVYNFLCVYRYFRRYSLRTKHITFLSSTASFVHQSFSFSHHLTIPSLRFKNEAFNISERYDSQSFFSVSEQHVVRDTFATFVNVVLVDVLCVYRYFSLKHTTFLSSIASFAH